MKTIKLFGIALEGDNFNYQKISELGLKVGYIIDPKASTKEVYEFLQTLDINTNTTFYKNWEDITSKSRFELFIDQIKHYQSTYGSDFKDTRFIVNYEFGKKVETLEFKEYKYIKAVTSDIILEKTDKLVSSGIALNEDTIKDIFEIYDRFNYIPDIDIIKNKEVKMQVYIQKNILPSNPEEFIRLMIYTATKSTLLIKDRKTISEIEDSGLDISTTANRFGLEKLSAMFLRFKPIFLAFKRANTKNKSTINKLRKLAKTNHQPYQKSFFEDLLSNYSKIDKLPTKINEINNFKKVSLIESINTKINDGEFSNYIIRNGKTFIKEKSNKITESEIVVLKLMKDIIYKSLIEDIKKNVEGKSFYIPSHYDIKLPRSEKTFLGNIPFGTEILHEGKDVVVGTNWRGEHGAEDIDISFINLAQEKIGWNSNYTNNEDSVIYSGDITSANPEATELLQFKGDLIEKNEGIINANLYQGDDNSKFTFFVGHSKDTVKRNEMLKRNEIVFQTEMNFVGGKNVACGITLKDRIVLQKIIMGNKAVSEGDNITTAYIKYIKAHQPNLLSLKDILKEAGAIEIKQDEFDKKNIEDSFKVEIDGKIPNKIDYNFFDIQKDMIINLMS